LAIGVPAAQPAATMGDLKLVRVVSRTFVAGFESDGVVRRCAPILKKRLLGKTDEEARAIIRNMGWTASVVSDPLHRAARAGIPVSDAPESEQEGRL
jgi:hypothetical protein